MRNIIKTDLSDLLTKGGRSSNAKVLTTATTGSTSSFSTQLLIAKTQAHSDLQQQHHETPRKNQGSSAGATTSGTTAQSASTISANVSPAIIQASWIVPVNAQQIDTGNATLATLAGSSLKQLGTILQPQNDKATTETKLSNRIADPSKSGENQTMILGTVAKSYPKETVTPLPQSVQQSLTSMPATKPVESKSPQRVQDDSPTIEPDHTAIQNADNNSAGIVSEQQYAQDTSGSVEISSHATENNRNTNKPITKGVENRNKPPVEILNNDSVSTYDMTKPNDANQKSHTVATSVLNGLVTTATGTATATVSANTPIPIGGVASTVVTSQPAATANSSAIQQEAWNSQSAPIDLTQPDWQHVIAKRIQQTPQGSMVQIQVHPNNLGPISMQANATNNVVSVQLHAANPQTQALLQQALPQISQSLSSLGSNASVVVSTNSFGAFGSGAQGQGQTPNQGQHAGGSSSHPSPMVPENSASSAIDSATSIATGFESWI